MTKKLKILRTGAGSPPSPPVIDALIKEGCEVVVADADPLSFGLYHYTESAVIPYASDNSYIPAVLEVCRKHGINVIIPTVDEELPLFARERDAFAQKGIEVVISEPGTIDAFNSKVETFATFSRIGLDTPATYRSLDAVGDIGRLIVKPAIGRGGEGVTLAESRDEAEIFARRLQGRDPVFQEFAEGTEFTVDALCDFDGRLLCGAVRERIRTESGICIKSRIADEPEIWKDVEKLTGAIKFRGPINVQCIKTKSGERKFFDLNPRYAGTVALSIAAGAPMVRDLVRLLRGEVVKPTGCVTNEKYMLRYWREEFVDPDDIIDKNGSK